MVNSRRRFAPRAAGALPADYSLITIHYSLLPHSPLRPAQAALERGPGERLRGVAVDRRRGCGERGDVDVPARQAPQDRRDRGVELRELFGQEPGTQPEQRLGSDDALDQQLARALAVAPVGAGPRLERVSDRVPLLLDPPQRESRLCPGTRVG